MTAESYKSVVGLNYTLSNDIIKLYSSAEVHNVNEALTVIFHAFLLESGFIPKDCPNEDKYQSMPENWNSNGIFKIKYVHHCCLSLTCLTCVPLYNTLSVHGIMCDVSSPESVDFKINVKKYLKQNNDFSKVSEVFCNIDELFRLFKDNFCLPLCNLLHEKIGKYPLYGIHGLYEELKMHILCNLPVEGVMSMSAVNKNFHALGKSTLLWKRLYKRDFSKNSIPDNDASTSETNWKQLYKKEYLKKKRRPLPKPCRLPRYPLSGMFDLDPDTDIGINFDPPIPEVYPPFLQPNFPPFRPSFPFTRFL